MKATDILMAEHRNIEGVLSALETATARLEAGDGLRPGFFRDAAEFISGYADGCHHHKEEDILFTAMVESGMPRNQGPIGVMLAEHEQARAFTRAMREGADAWEGGDDTAKARVLHAALGYAALLREHIMKEDNVLFPMAASQLGGSRGASVSAAIEELDRQEETEGTHQRFLDLAATLAAKAAA